MKLDYSKIGVLPRTINLQILIDSLMSVGGFPIAVGGCVRDFLLGKKPNDIDIEVYGLKSSKLLKTLRLIGKINLVGKSFGVFRVSISNDKTDFFDVSMPRLEKKYAVGHKGFLIDQNSNLTFKQASLRRDFTINSMGYDFKSNKIIDPYNGYLDLKNGLLRHVSTSFNEDPLRVFRACQFAARFNFKIHKSTLKLCQNLKNELKSLPSERLFNEFKKLLLSKKPSIGFLSIVDTGAIALFPEISSLIGCPQEKKWHPEGDVWIHTLLVIDEVAKLILKDNLNEEESLILLFASLCHDFGKPLVTCFEDGRIRSRNHESMGEIPTRSFLQKIGASQKLINSVVALVVNHLKPCQLFKVKSSLSNRAIRRLAIKVPIERLCRIAKADFLGRMTDDALSGYDPSTEWLLKKSKALLVQKEAPKSILLGRHLLNLGLKSGPLIGKLLKKSFIAQIDGKFDNVDDAIVWLMKNNKINTS